MATYKDNVRVATTGNITLSGFQAIDGVTVAAGDRVLVKDQTNGSVHMRLCWVTLRELISFKVFFL